MPEVLDDAHQF